VSITITRADGEKALGTYCSITKETNSAQGIAWRRVVAKIEDRPLQSSAYIRQWHWVLTYDVKIFLHQTNQLIHILVEAREISHCISSMSRSG
jgi:hypothetical protein